MIEIREMVRRLVKSIWASRRREPLARLFKAVTRMKELLKLLLTPRLQSLPQLQAMEEEQDLLMVNLVNLHNQVRLDNPARLHQVAHQLAVNLPSQHNPVEPARANPLHQLSLANLIKLSRQPKSHPRPQVQQQQADHLVKLLPLPNLLNSQEII